MNKEDKLAEDKMSTAIEDLTLDETETEKVKGGAVVKGNTVGSFSFGVEREMKE